MKLSGQTAYNLTLAVNEMDVSHHYREFLTRKISGLTFTSPYKCDGFGENEKLKIRLLCEFKEEGDLKSRLGLSSVLCQAIYYIKKFELEGKILPSTIFLADRDECTVIHTNDVINYLSMQFDWSIAPSSVVEKNFEFVKMVMEDEKINPFIFSPNQLDDVIEKIKDLTQNVKRLIPITNHNITEVFNYFMKNVIGKNNLSTNELANLFVQILVNPTENYLHPLSKISSIVTKTLGQIPVKNRKVYNSFFGHFKSEYSPKEKEVLTSIVDRLVEDVTRRKQGEFFTPSIWVDKAHEYITSVFGEDWKEKYVVWDPAWGTGNLTRDYKFKELYVSTLNQSDIDTANQMGYNPEAIKFQYDFLNDDYSLLPEGLRKVIEDGREIIVLMNPPYKKSTPNKGHSESDISNTKVGKEMNGMKLGISSSQLSTQFLYQVYKLNTKDNINIAIFNKPNYMSSDGFKELRTIFNKKFLFTKGFIFNAGHFNDVSNKWGITFSTFINGEKIDNQYPHDILDFDTFNGIFKNGEKTIYNCDNRRKANEFFKKYKSTVISPVLKSSLKLDLNKNKLSVENALGYINNDSNNVMQQRVVFIASSQVSANGGKPITKENFYDSISLFNARKSVGQNWLNDKDEYLLPNKDNENYEQFKFDSVIYSLFNNASEQSSLRQLMYKGNIWSIKNEFFWMSKEEMLGLANEYNYDGMYNDARTDSERYVYKLLFGEERIYDKLSSDAKLVLNKATDLVKKSMVMREEFANDENHLKAWDSGYAQLKLMWKEYLPEDFKEFRNLYKQMEDRMRPLVYELGFLIK